MIKLVVSDIDGTMLHDHGTSINPIYFDTIKKLHKHGIQFCVASGRQYNSLQTLFEPVKDDLIYITENGAEIIYKGRELYSNPMTKEDSEQLVLDTRAIPGAESMYCVGDKAYFEKGDLKVFHLMKDEYHFRCEMVDDLLKLEEPCLKFSLYLPEHVDEITNQYFTPKWKRTHDVACGGKYFMDVCEKGVNKGRSLRQVQSLFGVSREETMVFGDNHNDIDMIMEADYSYAVANAREELKRKAAYQTLSNNEDGVLRVLLKLLSSKHNIENLA